MGILSRLFGTRTSASGQSGAADPEAAASVRPAEVSTLDDAALAHFEESLRESAQVEFLTTTERLEQHDGLATDLSSEGFPLERARAILQEEWDRRVAWSVEHREQDQSAAVRRAFATLTRSGVLALENLGYDNSEGHDLATEAARAAGAPGYVFFHAQDAARLIDGPGTLHLRFAAARYESATAAGKDAEDEVVGRQVAAALEAEGLTATWDGSARSTITIQDLHWYAAPGPGSSVA